MKKPVVIDKRTARHIWMKAQKLDSRAPFGAGPEATRAAIEHLGYVQIDTISVVERAHHHILFSRIPDYRRADLSAVQSHDKSVFEYWTHALSYVPTRDLRFFLPRMKQHEAEPPRWFAKVDPAEYAKLLRRIRKDGAISIRDVEDDELQDKDHPWASRKPTKLLLQLGFYNGQLAISERQGMVKSYELIDRHFAWPPRPRAATPGQVAEYLLDRAIRSQGLISAASVMYPWLRFSPEIAALVESRVRRKQLVPVTIGDDATPHFAPPEVLENAPFDPQLVHVLSPFDPLIIQRRRTELMFGYDHVFEAYIPKPKRRFGYFTLPVLLGDEIVAVLDLKTDRAAGRLLIQAWHWVGRGNEAADKTAIEEELGRFERFQLGS
jgi:uncharacterized protein YcaQ